MPWFHFTHNYDHRWPSGAVTEHKAGSKLSVKKEVADAAKAAGAGEHLKEKPPEDEQGHNPARSGEAESLKVGNRVADPAKVGGHGFDQSGNPIIDGALPDPADPDAVRAEPLVERDRAREAGAPEEDVEDQESESQIEAETE